MAVAPDLATGSDMKADGDSAQGGLIGRDAELRRVSTAIRNRESLLIWGPADVGKTCLVKKAIAELPERDRKGCIYWSGEASVRDFAEELVRGLYAAGDVIVRRKVREDGGGRAISVGRWFRDRSSGQLKALLYRAAAKGRYAFFLDHMPPATQSMARFLKQIIWRCKTPVYLLARGFDHEDIGYAWSIYYVKEYRIGIDPLSETLTRELLDRCIGRFGLDRLDLTGFRDEILRLSRHLPGSVVKMCELAAHRRYHYGDQIKVNLVHVDYLMLGDPLRECARTSSEA
jgi:GTPase SAR1 family protein